MRILGIDPGTGILGFGVIDVDKNGMRLVDAGIVTTPAHTALAIRLEDIYDSIKEIIEQTSPDIMSIEKIFFSQNITTGISVSHARGVIMLLAKQHNLKIEEYTPLEIKRAITGYGRATKKQMQEMVRIQLKLKNAPQPDDCADALAAAIVSGFKNRYATQE